MVCWLATLRQHGSASGFEWQPHLEWFTHAGWEQRNVKYRSFPVWDKTRPASLQSILQREQRIGRKPFLNAVFVEKVTLWQDVDPNHFNSMTDRKTNVGCRCPVTERQVKPGHWRLTGVKLCPLASGVHKSWPIQRNQWSMALVFLINGSRLYLFHIVTQVIFVKRKKTEWLWHRFFLTAMRPACTFRVSFSSTSLDTQFTY